MERLYRGLAWLASVTIIVDLVASILYVAPAFNNTQQGVSVDGSSNSITVFLQLLATQKINMALSLANLLVSGVIVLAAALAWATGRRVWLIALIVVTLLTLIWPAIAFAWEMHYVAATLDAQIQSGAQVISYITIGVQLIPVALALIFGLVGRKPTATATTDVELGIERSAL